MSTMVNCCLFNATVFLSERTDIRDILAGDDFKTDAPDHGGSDMPDSAGDAVIGNILQDLWSKAMPDLKASRGR
ncbi:hypothetical protein PISMIDRAFT_18922 [Pisolithus microcarpus 441]|uniref:Uncharacterized protein n=1 Tax=Pisolithus microcarpus 441 TaxID=765257 RepID=A0A0C9YWA1_9AGAM|nr:hypothetical protein PISMIDRAFT_18922 [Pisolithus microcarpus 441]